MKRKGFTLIELLATIIVIAVVAVVSVPIVIDVIDDARKEANLQTAYGIIDAAKLYYTESLLDTSKQEDVENANDIYDKILMNNVIPEGGTLHVNKEGEVALSLVIDGVCYKKNMYQELETYEVTSSTECQLGFVGVDEKIPEIDNDANLSMPELSFTNWYTETPYIDIVIKGLDPEADAKADILLSDDESGISYYYWCVGLECDITTSSNYETTNKTIKIDDTKGTQVCVVAVDRNGNKNAKVCTDVLHVDTQAPTFTGTGTLTVNVGESVDLAEGISVTDATSGVAEITSFSMRTLPKLFTYYPEFIDTSELQTTKVTYTATDIAGNEVVEERIIIVDALSPTVVYTDTAEYYEHETCNESDKTECWAKEEFIVFIDITDNSEKGLKEVRVCTSTSGNDCDPTNGSIFEQKDFKACEVNTSDCVRVSRSITSEGGNNKICILAVDNNNKQTKICSSSYKLDKTAPTVGSVEIEGEKNSDINDWYVSDVTLSPKDGDDTLSGHLSTKLDKEEIKGDTAGTTVTVTTTDKAGNISTSTHTVKIDKTKPTVSFDIKDIDGENGWYKTKPTLTSTVTDTNFAYLKWCEGIDCNPLTESTENTKVITVSDTEGTQLCVIGIDKALNTSEKVCSDIIKVDTVFPSISGVGTLTVRKDEFISLTDGVIVEDATSKINGTYSYDPTYVESDKAGETTVTYKVKDKAGNETTVERKVIVSTDLPDIEFTAGDAINEYGWANKEFYVTINVTDNSGWGIKSFNTCTTYKDSECDPSTGSTTTGATTATRTIDQESNNIVVCAQAVDKYNQTSPVICSDIYKLDMTKPTAGTIKVNGNNVLPEETNNKWYTENLTIEAVDGQDALSDHLSTTVNVDNISTNTTGKLLTVTTTDKAGNTSKRNYTIKLDKTRPSCSFGTLDYLGANETANLDFTCTNEISGIKDETLSPSVIGISNNKAVVNSITKVKVENGYKYTITLKGVEAGEFNVILRADTVTTNASLGNTEITSSNITVTSVELGEIEDTVYVGGGNYTIDIIGTNSGNLSCESSNPSVATCSIVDGKLSVVPVANGKTSITVKESNGNAETKFNVTIILPTLTVNPTSSTIYVGGSSAEATISGNNYGDLTCSSSNSSVAGCTINGNKLTVNPLTAGNSIITITESNGNVTATYNVVVIKPTLTVNPTSSTIYVGGSSAEATISGNNYGNLTCSSSNKTVAGCTINGNKLTINPLTAGNSTITITESNGNVTAEYDVTVIATSLVLTSTSGETYPDGGNLTTYIDKDASNNYGKLSCSSSDEAIATCSISGTTITMTPGEKTGSAVITVKESNGNKTAKYTFNNKSVSFTIDATFEPIDAKYYEDDSIKYWLNESYFVKVNVTSSETISKIEMCTATTNTCDPTGKSSSNGTNGSMEIKQESNNNRVCVQAYDQLGRLSSTICSEAFGLDTVKPTAGTILVNGKEPSTNWYNETLEITKQDGTDESSGHLNTSIDVTSITSNTNGKVVTVTTTDKAGNSSTRTYTLKTDITTPIVNITKASGSTLLTANVTNLANIISGVSYQWYNGSDAISGATKSTYTPTTSGNYKVVVTTGAGKSGTSSVQTIDKYTITYNLNGGTCTLSSQTKIEDISVTLSTPSSSCRSGYSFMGWGTSSTDTTAKYAAGANYTENSDITLYAIWKKSVTITFAGNGANISSTSATCDIYNAETSCSIQTPTITRTNYEVVGFNTNASAETSQIDHDATVSVSENKKYYAITYKTLTASFDANGANLSSSTNKTCKIYNTNTSCSVTLPTITRSSYEIVGFNLSSTSKDSLVDSGKTATLTSDTKYYAVTKKTITVTFDGNGATSGSTAKQTCDMYNKDESCSIKLNSNGFNKTNYGFKGWGTTTTSVKYNPSTSYDFSKDTTLYAIWAELYDGIADIAYTVGQTVTYQGIEFLVVKDNGDTVTLVTKNNVGTGAFGTNTTFSGSLAYNYVNNTWVNNNSGIAEEIEKGGIVLDSSTNSYVRLLKDTELSTKLPNGSGTNFWTMSSNGTKVYYGLPNGSNSYTKYTASANETGVCYTGSSTDLSAIRNQYTENSIATSTETALAVPSATTAVSSMSYTLSANGSCLADYTESIEKMVEACNCTGTNCSDTYECTKTTTFNTTLTTATSTLGSSCVGYSCTKSATDYTTTDTSTISTPYSTSSWCNSTTTKTTDTTYYKTTKTTDTTYYKTTKTTNSRTSYKTTTTKTDSYWTTSNTKSNTYYTTSWTTTRSNWTTSTTSTKTNWTTQTTKTDTIWATSTTKSITHKTTKWTSTKTNWTTQTTSTKTNWTTQTTKTDSYWTTSTTKSITHKTTNYTSTKTSWTTTTTKTGTVWGTTTTKTGTYWTTSNTKTNYYYTTSWTTTFTSWRTTTTSTKTNWTTKTTKIVTNWTTQTTKTQEYGKYVTTTTKTSTTVYATTTKTDYGTTTTKSVTVSTIKPTATKTQTIRTTTSIQYYKVYTTTNTRWTTYTTTTDWDVYTTRTGNPIGTSKILSTSKTTITIKYTANIWYRCSYIASKASYSWAPVSTGYVIGCANYNPGIACGSTNVGAENRAICAGFGSTSTSTSSKISTSYSYTYPTYTNTTYYKQTTTKALYDAGYVTTSTKYHVSTSYKPTATLKTTVILSTDYYTTVTVKARNTYYTTSTIGYSYGSYYTVTSRSYGTNVYINDYDYYTTVSIIDYNYYKSSWIYSKYSSSSVWATDSSFLKSSWIYSYKYYPSSSIKSYDYYRSSWIHDYTTYSTVWGTSTQYLKSSWIYSYKYYPTTYVANYNYSTTVYINNYNSYSTVFGTSTSYMKSSWINNYEYYPTTYVANYDYYKTSWISNYDKSSSVWATSTQYLKSSWVSSYKYYTSLVPTATYYDKTTTTTSQNYGYATSTTSTKYALSSWCAGTKTTIYSKASTTLYYSTPTATRCVGSTCTKMTTSYSYLKTTKLTSTPYKTTCGSQSASCSTCDSCEVNYTLYTASGSKVEWNRYVVSEQTNAMGYRAVITVRKK